jgi:FemAB-related protein (PEP-CTERM system-associated)
MNAFAPICLRAAGEDPRLEPFIRAHPDATPFHLPQWSKAIEAGTGQRAYMLVAEAGGEVQGVLPLTHIRSRLFGSALASAGFGVGGGILATNEAAIRALADQAVSLADELNCGAIELRGGQLPEGWARDEETYAGFARDLPAGDEAILASIPRKQRAEVRRAIGFGLEVGMGDDDAHYRVYAESVRNLGTPVFPRALFDAVLAGFGADADVLTIAREGTPLAAVLSLYFNDTVYPYWGGGTRLARDARANELLYYELMRHASRRGCTRFDFGRSKAGTGAWSFKKNWGFEPVPLAYASWGKAREINPLNPRYRLRVAAWRKLPLWIANRAGPMIARSLG